MPSLSTLPVQTIAAGTLLQHVSRVIYRDKPLYFGRDRTSRYDDPAKNFGVLYLAFDLSTALMESVFRKHNWAKRKRTITLSEAKQRMVRAVGAVDTLNLADLTAPGVMASHFGLNLSQLASRKYHHTQRISAMVHEFSIANGARFDGIIFPSRNNYPATCIALFEDAKNKIDPSADFDLIQHTGWPAFLTAYEVIVLPR